MGRHLRALCVAIVAAALVLQAPLAAAASSPALQATQLKPALSLTAVLNISKGSRGFDAAARAAFAAGFTSGLAASKVQVQIGRVYDEYGLAVVQAQVVFGAGGMAAVKELQAKLVTSAGPKTLIKNVHHLEAVTFPYWVTALGSVPPPTPGLSAALMISFTYKSSQKPAAFWTADKAAALAKLIKAAGKGVTGVETAVMPTIASNNQPEVAVNVMVSGTDMPSLIALTDKVTASPWDFLAAYEIHNSELQFVGTAKGAPSDPFVLASATVTGPTSATITASAPATKDPWKSFMFIAVALDGRTITLTSSTPVAQFKNLAADTVYTVKAVAIGSGQSLAVNPMTFTTLSVPAKGAPLLIAAVATAPTTAYAAALPLTKCGSSSCATYTFTAVPAAGGPAVTATCQTSNCPITGLAAATQYTVRAVGSSARGAATSQSNPITFDTPVAKSSQPALTGLLESSTSAKLSATAVSGAQKYLFSQTPLDGGHPALVASSAPTTQFAGLKSAQRYMMSLVVVVPGGVIPAASSLVISTSSDLTPAPVLIYADASSPTTALMTTSPDSTVCPTGPCTTYTYTLKPRPSGTAITATCAIPGPCTAKGLQPTTTYDVTVVARDAANNPTASSRSLPLRTMDFGAPLVIGADPLSPSTGVLESMAPETGCKAGPCTKYIYHLTAADPSKNVTAECPSVAPCNVTGLSSNTDYEVTVDAADGEGNLLPGANSLTLTTLGLPGPNIIVCEATNLTTAKLRAAQPDLGCGADACASFLFTLTPKGGAGKQVNVSCPLAGDCPVAGLEDNTSYDVLAVVVDSVGNPSPPSDVRYLVTPAVAPPILIDVDALDPTTGYATSLAPSTGCKLGPCTNYNYTIYPRTGETPMHVSCNSSAMCTFDNLTADTTYFVTVVASDAGGNESPASRSTRFLTPPFRAPVVRSAAATGPTSAVFTCSEPQTGCVAGACKSFLFIVRLKDMGGAGTIFTCSSPKNCKATGLQPNSSYEVSAVAKDALGNSSPASAYIEFKTPAS